MARNSLIALLSFASMILPALPAAAQNLPAPLLQPGAELDVPRGFVEMCRQGGELCGGARKGALDPIGSVTAAAPTSPAAPRTDTASLFTGTGAIASGERNPPAAVSRFADGNEIRMLRRVNQFVNGHVQQQTDQQIYGVAEVWRASGTERGARGDCEDLAIEKRLQLLRAGFAPDRLFFAIVYRGDVGLHTVLVARVAEGDMVLDSRTPYVVPWTEAPYAWVGFESLGDPTRWYRPSKETLTVALQSAHRRS